MWFSDYLDMTLVNDCDVKPQIKQTGIVKLQTSLKAKESYLQIYFMEDHIRNTSIFQYLKRDYVNGRKLDIYILKGLAL